MEKGRPFIFVCFAVVRVHSNLMKFLAFESLRISLKLNISAAREQQAVGLGPLMWLHHG